MNRIRNQERGLEKQDVIQLPSGEGVTGRCFYHAVQIENEIAEEGDNLR